MQKSHPPANLPQLLATPYYVLLAGAVPFSPRMIETTTFHSAIVLFGFSDKMPYDRFQANTRQGLTPFPLVKRTMASHLAARNRCLVVVDAVSPNDILLYAASMQSVLLAHETKASHVPLDCELAFVPESAGYVIRPLVGNDRIVQLL